MTAEEARALPESRQLDDLVYLHVFGIPYPCNCGTGAGDPNEVCGICGKPTRRQWSSEIDSAWEVKEAVRRRGDGYAWSVYAASIARVWGETATEAARLLCAEAVAALLAEGERKEVSL